MKGSNVSSSLPSCGPLQENVESYANRELSWFAGWMVVRKQPDLQSFADLSMAVLSAHCESKPD
ncbi:hypothetical protein [Ruegeria sp. MALMAid1280]|uniref:hypothetical protein n=1 Tax=Ruegeria sp. MALMAid1280 TaxID=3411634 RepID=UPI003B9EFA92